MRKVLLVLAAVPVTLAGIGCSVTTPQLQDFVYSASVRVFVQTVSNVIESAVLQNAAQ